MVGRGRGGCGRRGPRREARLNRRTHPVDLESTEGNDLEEDALDPPDPPLNPIDEGAPPGDGDGAPQSDQKDDGGDGDDGEGT